MLPAAAADKARRFLEHRERGLTPGPGGVRVLVPPAGGARRSVELQFPAALARGAGCIIAAPGGERDQHRERDRARWGWGWSRARSLGGARFGGGGPGGVGALLRPGGPRGDWARRGAVRPSRLTGLPSSFLLCPSPPSHFLPPSPLPPFPFSPFPLCSSHGSPSPRLPSSPFPLSHLPSHTLSPFRQP